MNHGNEPKNVLHEGMLSVRPILRSHRRIAAVPEASFPLKGSFFAVLKDSMGEAEGRLVSVWPQRG